MLLEIKNENGKRVIASADLHATSWRVEGNRFVNLSPVELATRAGHAQKALWLNGQNVTDDDEPLYLDSYILHEGGTVRFAPGQLTIGVPECPASETPRKMTLKTWLVAAAMIALSARKTTSAPAA